LQIASEKTQARQGAGAAHQKLARTSDARVLAFRIDDSYLDARSGAAETSRAALARLAMRDDGRPGTGLRHGPGLQQRESEASLERRVLSCIDPGAEPEAQRVLAIRRTLGRLQQQCRHHSKVVQNRGARS